MSGKAANGNPKSIVLFSDGTGNSSAKLIRTNVWRVYEAVDLGPAAEGRHTQIAYYDDGVGTSSFRPLAVLGGAFGYGLKRNVRDIYKYTCRNYRPGTGQEPGANPDNLGDHIYGFGFSRGAFTMRLVIALIASQGLVVSSSEAELEWKSRQAYRAFRKDFLPRKWQAPTKAVRWILEQWNRLREYRHGEYRITENHMPVIRFVGVWDTVAAYGGPFAETTRAIDNWIYPLSMPDYRLHGRVQCARHALALDDERESFHPLLWDEVSEEKRGLPPGRMQQVWFTGMHSDVGGGYPDESLSYVSLLWMLEEAEKVGLRTLKYIVARYHALANSYGPIHDSRSGVGSYYRYQPRKIAAWLHPVDTATLGLRDPLVMYPPTHDDGTLVQSPELGNRKPRGLLTSVKVHESVIARINAGTDRYAPITLPGQFDIVPPQRHGETEPQAHDRNECALLSQQGIGRPMVTKELRATLARSDVQESRSKAMEEAWDWVWARRMTYFATVLLTILLVGMPFIGAYEPPILIGIWLAKTIKLLSFALPGFADLWIDCYALNPSWFVMLVAGIFGLTRLSNRIERNLRDKARQVWRNAVRGIPTTAAPEEQKVPALQRFRNSLRYQQTMQAFKWGVLPLGFGVVFGALTIWLATGFAAQLRLPYLENGADLCANPANASTEITAMATDFTTRDACHSLGGTVEADKHYTISFEVSDTWKDGDEGTTPLGLKARALGWRGFVYSLFRRVFDANYLAPVIQVRSPHRGRGFGNVQLHALDLKPTRGSTTTYTADFVPSRSGEASLFANDAVWPFAISVEDMRSFYESYPADSAAPGNHGSACVTIVREDHAENEITTRPELCRQLADARTRNRDAAEPVRIASGTGSPMR